MCQGTGEQYAVSICASSEKIEHLIVEVSGGLVGRRTVVEFSPESEILVLNIVIGARVLLEHSLDLSKVGHKCVQVL